MTRALPILAGLALLGANSCPKTIPCPSTEACPAGVCVPGAVSGGIGLVCKDPVTPSPMPTPTPQASPSESPAPSPTPSPVTSPSPSPTETPIPASPSPSPVTSPRPSSTPVPTCLGVPTVPVPLVYDSDQCPEGLIQHGRVPDGRRVCVAETYCGLDTCQPGNCRSPAQVVHGLQVDVDYSVSPRGFVCDRNGGPPRPSWCFDAYGRKYSGGEPQAGQQPFRESPDEDGPWRVQGFCRPRAADPCPTPPPTPWPTATPGPAPTPIVTPPPTQGDGVIPSIGSCPAGWPIHPDFVTIGEKPWRAPANKFAWIFNVTPRRSDPRYCLNEHGVSRGVPCEEWIPCALRQDSQGNYISQVAAKAWGPGFNGDDVERRSGNPNLLNMVLGPDGSPPGRYEICVAPTAAQIKTGAGMCRWFELTLPE